MTRFLKELQPSTIHDINAMVALYRPGPLESIPQYIERKHTASMISYLDPRLKDILDQSYGVITYQDDVLLIAITIGGYSWLEADKLRKAMGKKIPEEMAAQKEKLTKGFVEHGKLTKEKAERLWKLIEPFAAYGFNKAHAASYGRVAYQTAYMKANFPVEYMACVLTADSGDVEKVSEIITEVKRMKISVLPPDVNESYGVFSVVPNEPEIRFGLYSIKNFGTGIADVVIEERKQNGPYTSLGNFLKRVQDKNLNKKSIEALIKSGALDEFGERGIMLANIEHLISYTKEASANGNQDSLFGGMQTGGVADLTLEPAEEATQAQKLQWEKELLGLYISGHPLDKHREKLNNRGKTITTIKQTTYEGVTTVVGGIIEDLRIVLTKKGDKMAFAKIADLSGSIEIVFFPKLFTEQQTLVVPEACVAVKGRYSLRNGEPSIVAEAVKAL
jgi:DNA polymerase-3 subunit alpha